MQKKLISLIGLILLSLNPKVSEAQVVIGPSRYVNGGGIASGPLYLPNGTAAAPSLTFVSRPTTGIFHDDTYITSTVFAAGGASSVQIDTNGLTLFNGKTLNFTGSTVSVYDLILARDAANTLAQRHGTNVQAFNIYTPGLITTPQALKGLLVLNNTAATAGVPVQMSGRTTWRGTAWDTSASKTVDFFIENLPATAATPTGTLKFGYSLNGAAATYPMTLSSSGQLITSTSISVTNGWQFGTVTLSGPAAGYFGWTNRGFMTSPANAQFNLINTAETAGIGFDVSTDAILKLKDRAQTGGAAIEYLEQTAPAAGAANTARIFSQDNGAGKTQMCAIFNTGAVQCFATQP